MDYKRIKLAVLALFLAAALPLSICAQETTNEKEFPLHLDISFGVNSQGNHIKPFEGLLDLSYSVTKNFSIHAVSQNTYFMYKEGTSHKYNMANNLGGGLAYRFLPETGDGLGNFEARAFVTTSVNSGDFKNTAYNVGLYWYTSSKSIIKSVIGIGYSAKDFSAAGMKTHHSFYVSLGLRI